MKKEKRLSNFEKLSKSIEKIPPDKLGLIASVGLFLAVSLLFYQQFLWWSGDRIAVPIPGMMSVVPLYNIDASYNESFKLNDALFLTLNACSTIESICVPCVECSADLYYDYGNGKELYKTDLDFINGSTAIQIRTIPTWLYVSINGTYFNYIRIPDPSLLDYVIESSRDLTNKLTFFVTWSWLISFLILVISIIRRVIRYIRNKINRKKDLKNKPEYIG